MEIYIEVIIILICFLIILFWKIWKEISKKILQKKYSINNDKSKNGEVRQSEIRESERRAINKEKQGVGINSTNPIRPAKSERRGVLPKATTSTHGKNSSSFGKFLKRRRRK